VVDPVITVVMVFYVSSYSFFTDVNWVE
jgi:hypothetical protein